MSPAWAPDGRRFSYMEFWAGHGQLFVQPVGPGKRQPVATTGQALDFTPAFSPDGKTLAFSRAIEEGTDVYTVNIKDGCCLQRLTVGRFRSEERRVGKECRSRWSQCHEKKKTRE